MKKQIFLSAIVAAVLISCGTKDDKNGEENYPTYDTTEKMENINSADPANSSLNQEPSAGEPN